MKRVLLSAYQCAPGAGSVSQIGWEWYTRLASRMHVTLATHVRNRALLENAGAPLPNTEVIYIDTEWLARPLYAASKRLFPKSEHSVFLLSSLDYFAFDSSLVRELKNRMRCGEQWDIIHVATPVSPSSFSRLPCLALPVVRGPLNGGLKTPSQFPGLMKADSAWLYPLRDLSKPIRALLGKRVRGNVVLAANPSTRESLTTLERSVARPMMEIGVDPEQFKAAPWPAAPGCDDPLKILFVGRLIPAKALSLLIDAIRELEEGFPVELTVIGDGPMRAAWEKHASDLGAAVRFVGAKSSAEIARAMEDTHVFCLPSVRESGGAVLLEAMSCARPVIGIAHGGPAGIITSEVGLLVDPKGPRAVVDGLKAAIKDVFLNPESWRERGRKGREVAERVHSWDAHLDQMCAIFDEITVPVVAGAA